MKEIYIFQLFGRFAEDKDKARDLRINEIVPSLESGQDVVLDFASVRLSTQSFIHALISDLIRKKGIDVLDHIFFKNCNGKIKTLIETVVQYLQEEGMEFSSEQDGNIERPK